MARRPPRPQLRLDVLEEAVLDAYILLSRGYPRRLVMDAVAARRGLNQWERLAVYHCVHPRRTILRIRASTRCEPGGFYAVDGYNAAVSLACMQLGVPVLICPDGFVRDAMGGWKPTPEEAYEPLIEFLGWLRSKLGAEPIVYLDSRVSRSGVLASMLRSAGFIAATSKTTDKSVLYAAARRGYTPVTSDIVVLERVGGCNALTHYALTRGAEAIDISLLLHRGLWKAVGLWGLA